MGDHYCRYLGDYRPSDSEAQFSYEELTGMPRFLYCREQVEEQHADTLQETTILAAEDIHEKLVEVVEHVDLILLVVLLLHCFPQEGFQVEGVEDGCAQLLVRVLDHFLFEKEAT